MNENLPEPPVSPEISINGFSGFVLDIDRLLASELVALGAPEECWAAFMLWCRAWKQTPPGSVPNDERVLAAFSGAGRRWPKVREVAMRGFVLCRDNRFYHPVVVEHVLKVWKKRSQYKADQDRLKRWREEKRNGKENVVETRFTDDDETGCEMVSEPEVKLKLKKERKNSDPNGSAQNAPNPVKALFDVGVQILSATKTEREARSLVGMWRKSLGDEELMPIITAAAKRTEPVAYLQAAVAKALERKAKPYGEAML